MYKFLVVTFLISLGSVPGNNPNLLCGKWMSAEKNLEVEVYRDHDIFKGKVIWFRDDESKPMDEWTDKHNPDPALRNRKLLGMNILRDMIYRPKSDSWEDGKIYDAKSGHEWDAAAKITETGDLKVTGYWHLKFIGKTMLFHRVKD
jgi:uncharacterized protein (DUF2147 family)